jgi:hypothetical protein
VNPDLHTLASGVTLPPGAPAWYGDDLPGSERPVAGEADARAIIAALARGERVGAALATGDTGIEIYRNAAVAARFLRPHGLRVRVRWGPDLGIKAAALALLFGADELVGPLAPHEIARRIAIIGGPPEDPARPTRSHVEALIRAAGRTPERLEATAPATEALASARTEQP